MRIISLSTAVPGPHVILWSSPRCQHACPAGIDVPNYVAAIAGGKYEQAVDIIRERNPFPAVCGRICIHPCEFKCRRGELDEPVAIRLLKRFASDWYFDHIGMAKKPFPITKGQKAAVVGAGPAGLTPVPISWRKWVTKRPFLRHNL